MSLNFHYTINLRASNAEETNEFLEVLMERIKKIVRVLRTQDSMKLLKNKCPTLVPTRWLYPSDTLKFFGEKRIWNNRYLLQVRSSYSVDEDMIHLYQILLPIRLLIMKVEAGDCALATFIPLFDEKD